MRMCQTTACQDVLFEITGIIQVDKKILKIAIN